MIPQTPTAPGGRKPPSGNIDRVGANRIAASWIRSSSAKSCSRANSTIEPTEIAA
jgi:hypothetical protein